MATKADIQAELDQLKLDVVAKVRELTEAHGWCDAAEEALEELGLVETPGPTVVQVTIRDPRGLKDQTGFGSIEDAVICALDAYLADATDAEVVKENAR